MLILYKITFAILCVTVCWCLESDEVGQVKDDNVYVMLELFDQKNYQGVSANLTFKSMFPWFYYCYLIPEEVYKNASSLIFHYPRYYTKFYDNCNCYPENILTVTAGDRLPDLSLLNVENKFMSYKFTPIP